jgi:phosphate transport system permease protein
MTTSAPGAAAVTTGARPTGTRRPPPKRRRTPRRPVAFTPIDVVLALAAAVSSISFCWLTFSVLTDGIGWFGFWVVAYVIFLAIYFVVTLDRVGRLAAVDRLVTVIAWTAMIVVLVPLVWLIVYILAKGLPALSLGFFVHTQKGVVPTDPATAGGGLHAIVGTIEQVGIALVISLPLGVMTAIFLNETRSKLRRPVRIFVDAMSGMPSVVSGLFIYATLIIPLAKDSSLFGYNGFMASLALSVTMMPTICRAVEVVLRLVPAGLREAGLALGSSRAKVVWSVVLPTASSGVATAAILGIAREAGETAPLLFTAFGYNLMNANPFSGAQESLPLFIYRFIREPLATSIARGFAGALVLMLLILLLFVVARVVGRDRTKARRSRGWSKRLGALIRSPDRSATPASPVPTGPALAKEPS